MFYIARKPVAQRWPRGQTMDGKTIIAKASIAKAWIAKGPSGIACAVRLALEPLQSWAADETSRKPARHRCFGSKNGGIVPRLVSQLSEVWNLG